MTDTGKKVPVVENQKHIAGNVCTEELERIQKHRFGAPIFYTGDTMAWNDVNWLAEFTRDTNSPVADDHGNLYLRPFNMYPFHWMRGVTSPETAKTIISHQRKEANNPCTRRIGNWL